MAVSKKRKKPKAKVKKPKIDKDGFVDKMKNFIDSTKGVSIDNLSYEQVEMLKELKIEMGVLEESNKKYKTKSLKKSCVEFNNNLPTFLFKADDYFFSSLDSSEIEEIFKQKPPFNKFMIEEEELQSAYLGIIVEFDENKGIYNISQYISFGENRENCELCGNFTIDVNTAEYEASIEKSTNFTGKKDKDVELEFSYYILNSLSYLLHKMNNRKVIVKERKEPLAILSSYSHRENTKNTKPVITISDKKIIYENCTSCKKEKEYIYKIDEFSRRGYWRTYKSGKKVWINATTVKAGGSEKKKSIYQIK